MAQHRLAPKTQSHRQRCGSHCRIRAGLERPQRLLEWIVGSIANIVLTQGCSNSCIALVCMLGQFRYQAPSRIEEAFRRRFDALEMMFDEKVLLVSDAADDCDIDHAGSQCRTCLVQCNVKLSRAGICDEV